MKHKISVSDAYLQAFENVNQKLLQLLHTDDEKLKTLSQEYFDFSEKIIAKCNNKDRIHTAQIVKLVLSVSMNSGTTFTIQ